MDGQITGISLGDYHSCATILVGTSTFVKCWGLNRNGQLGLGNTASYGISAGQMQSLGYIPFASPQRSDVLMLESGGNHNCVSFSDKSMRCWGSNYSGELGQGHFSDIGIEAGDMGANLAQTTFSPDIQNRAVYLDSFKLGGSHSCAIVVDKSANRYLKCWGDNDYGQLGLGDTNERSDDNSEMVPTLPYVPIPGSPNKVGLGAAHTCVTIASVNNGLFCFGANSDGQLGRENSEDLGDEPNEVTPTANLISLVDKNNASEKDLKIVSFGLGLSHTCVLFSNFQVKCFGDSFFGQLGYGDQTTRGDEPNEMGKNLPFLNLGKGLQAEIIEVGGNHNCAIFVDKRMKCWGLNMYGQLGLGDAANRGIWKGGIGDGLPFVSLGSGRSVLSVKLGHDHTCVLLDTKVMRCFGLNNYGQLGYGDIVNRGNSKAQAPDALSDVYILLPTCATYQTKETCGKSEGRCAWVAITKTTFKCVSIPNCSAFTKTNCIAAPINKALCLWNARAKVCSNKA